jgi:hypothetical protein
MPSGLNRFRHYATGAKGTVEIESQWTAFRRRNHLPEGVRLKEGERFRFPALSAMNLGRMARPPLKADVE